MKKYLGCLVFVAFLLTGCGFHLQHTTEVPKQFQTMVYASNDPYGKLSREIKSLLTDNNVKLVNDNENGAYPTLRIVSTSLDRNTISIYQDGKSAEYQLTMNVDAQVIIAGQDIYPINVKVFRTFFDNPAAALAKTTEQTLIENEMYQQAAVQLLRRLKSVDNAE